MKTSEIRNTVRCPYCREKIGTQPESVLSIYDPHFKHPGCKTEAGRGESRASLIVESGKGKRVGIGYSKISKNEQVVAKKKRKPRSDAGKKRGKYKPRQAK